MKYCGKLQVDTGEQNNFSLVSMPTKASLELATLIYTLKESMFLHPHYIALRPMPLHLEVYPDQLKVAQSITTSRGGADISWPQRSFFISIWF